MEYVIFWILRQGVMKMEVYYVSQNETYEQEITKQYLWTRQLTRDGKYWQPYENVKEMKKGDFVFHLHKSKIVAISCVVEDGKDYNLSEMPLEDRAVYKDGMDEGYLARLHVKGLSTYVEQQNFIEWIKSNIDDSELITYGEKTVKKIAYALKMKPEEIRCLTEQIRSAGNENLYLWKLSEYFDIAKDYTDDEKEKIEKAIDTIEKTNNREHFEKEPKEAKYVYSRKIPKRNLVNAAEALIYANYKCEVDNSHRTFQRKNGKAYTEAHHLVPISKTGEFRDDKNNIISLDVVNNIVSLCSYCHGLLHHGTMEEKEPVLKKLYEERKKYLEDAGIKLDFEELKKYYM